MLNLVLRYLYNKYRPEGPRWLPLAAVYYLTYNCRLRCVYCSDGTGAPYYSLAEKTPPLAEIKRILAAIRRSCPTLILTGGEPACHPEFAEVLRVVRELAFDEVILTTKGDELEGLDEALNGCVTRLVLSVDTLDPVKAAELCGSPVLEKTLRSIEHLSGLPGRTFEIYISSVVGTFNLDDLPQVCEFAGKARVWYAAQPQLRGVKAPEALLSDVRYRNFYDYLIRKKRAGAKVFGPVRYLELLRDFEKFDCHPFTMLVVAPGGEVFYPCLEIGHKLGRIQDAPDADALRREGMLRYGSKPLCDNRCHSACAAEYAVFMRHPMDALKESLSSTITSRRRPSARFSP